MEKRKEKKTTGGHSESMIEDYGDYVTRCICDFQHDDGYMICCDECGVWQHIECMQVDTKNLPENYLCEQCDPRPVDRKRARHAQIKKREDLSDIDEDDDSPPGRKGLSSSSSSMKKKRKRGKSTDSKPEAPPTKSNKSKKDALPTSIKKPKKKSIGGGKSQLLQGRVGSIQSLLNAASLLESVDESGTETSVATSGRSREHHRSTDIWNANLSPWSDKYDIIDHNRYSEPVRSFISSHLSQLKSEAVVYSQEEYLTWDQRNQPQCDVAEVGRRRKGLVATADIPEDELVIEYMGKITVKHLVVGEVATEGVKSLWRQRPCPFVYSYDKISGIDMCIDARKSGTVARFLRRSCSPNSEIRHFFVSNELHFGIYALNNIAEGEEITLPFDFKFEKCEYMMECACGQPWTMCVVARTPRKHPSTKSSNPTVEHTSVRGPPSRQQSLSHLSSAGDEDSNSSWVSSSGGKKRSRHHQGGSGHGPLSPNKPSQHTSLEGTSDSEDDGSAAKEKEKRRKSLSREERKTEQVWRLVEKMEASLQRKQRQQLLSEGSAESDPPIGSPSQLQPTSAHLFTSFKAATPTSAAGGKDKKGSSASRKPPLYLGTKMRLSSVSSTDALSPCELSEALSPPFTPGPTTMSDATLTPSHIHSPLISPPPTLSSHKPTFIVTPDLHPKYLLADFALPCKKAFLKQWEDEQRKDNGHTHPYWPIGHAFPAYHLTEEQTRRRIRGSLKHRWLKQHREEKEKASDGSVAMESGGRPKAPPTAGDEHDKENLHMSTPVSHKKLLLLRWEQSSFDKSTLPLSPPPSPHASLRPHTPPSDEPEVKRPEVKRHDSPLFEELSDEEFEDARKTADSASEEKELPKPTPSILEDMETDKYMPSDDEEWSPGATERTSKVQDEVSLNLSSVSDVSLESSPGGDDDDLRDGPKTPPMDTNKQTLVNVSDISSDFDNDQSLDGPKEEAPANQAEKKEEENEASALQEAETVATPTDKPEDVRGEDVPSNQAVSEEVPSQVLAADEEMKSAECAESATSIATTEDAAEGDVPHPLPAEAVSLQESAPPSPTAMGTPTKTPGKRKINLSEYRNRARKPVERKTSSEKSSPPASISTSSLLSSSSSFLSQSSLASRILSLSSQSSSLKLSSSAGLIGMSSLSGQVGGAGGSGPYFEPVSPDDDDKTPTGSEEVSVSGDLNRPIPQQQLFVSMPSASGFPATQSILGSGEHAAPPAAVQQMIVTPGGAFPPQHPPQSPLVHMVQPGGTVLQTPPLPPPGVQYGMWPPASGASVVEPAIDPRKGLIPIPPGHAVVQQGGNLPPPQHGMYPVHSAPLIQPGVIQHQTHAGDMGGMFAHGGGRGEFHHHGFVGHPPPPGAPGYRPRPPGPGGNYY